MYRLSHLEPQSPARRLRRLIPWGLVGLLAAGCLVDDDNRCGEHQVLWDNDLRCICAEGYVVSAEGGCAPVDANAPTGVGTQCTSDADCAGFAADYCESLFSKTCLVKNCTLTPDNCFQGFECCSLSSIPGFESVPPLCVAQGLCAP
ncbi:MAG: hypothetical protein ABI895_16985 [Deltaproteobacteria bacterium]